MATKKKAKKTVKKAVKKSKQVSAARTPRKTVAKARPAKKLAQKQPAKKRMAPKGPAAKSSRLAKNAAAGGAMLGKLVNAVKKLSGNKNVPASVAPPARPGKRTRSGGESGDQQGLSNKERADSESVDELLDEGNAFEAGVVGGVEEADDQDEREVHTHEVLEDDVPEEYLDEE